MKLVNATSGRKLLNHARKKLLFSRVKAFIKRLG